MATVVLPVKGAKVQKPMGENTHVRSTVMPTEPTMAKPQSMPSSKSGLSLNAIRTKGCVNKLLRKSDKNYLASKRRGCKGYDNIVKTCFGCGDAF